MPVGKPKAILVLSHGMGEHSGRYTHVAQYMTGSGYAVWGCDHRGHGRSGGKRGHVDNFNDYVADINQMIRIAKERTPDSKTFLLGHSLGGLIALNYAEKHGDQLAGLVVTSPGLKAKIEISPARAVIIRIVSKIAPSLSIRTGLDANLISRDKEVVSKYVKDPLVHRVATMRFVTEFLGAQDETVRAAERLTVPCLILQAGADGLVDPVATSSFFKKVASPDKILKVYEGFYHEVLNEPGKGSVLGEIDTWLSARI